MGEFIFFIAIVVVVYFGFKNKLKGLFSKPPHKDSIQRQNHPYENTKYPPWSKTWFPDGYQKNKHNTEELLYGEDFDWAFDKVISKINTGEQNLSNLREKLRKAEKSGESKLTEETIEYFLPEGVWSWPAFDKYWFKMISELKQEKYNELSELSLEELLLRLPVYEISNIQKQSKLPLPTKRLKKMELVRHLVDTLKVTATDNVRKQAQGILIEREIDRHNNKVDKTRVTELCSLLSSFRYARHRLRQQLSHAITTCRPKWIMHGDRYPKHPACMKFYGYKNFDDPSWECNYPPHGVGCSCYIETSRK